MNPTHINVTIQIFGPPGSGKTLVLNKIRDCLYKGKNGTWSRSSDCSARFTAIYYNVPLGKGKRCQQCHAPMNTKGNYRCVHNDDGSVNCSLCNTISFS